MFILLDETTIVNTNHVVSVDFYPAQPAHFDEEEQKEVRAKRAKVEITTTAIDFQWAGVGVAAAGGSESHTIVRHGEIAEKAFQFFSTFDGQPTRI